MGAAPRLERRAAGAGANGRAIAHHTLHLLAEGHGLVWTRFEPVEQVERICIPDFDRPVARS